MMLGALYCFVFRLRISGARTSKRILKERVTQEIVFSNRASGKPVPGCSSIVEVRECGRFSRRAIGVKCLIHSELQIRKVEAKRRCCVERLLREAHVCMELVRLTTRREKYGR